jgi:hypothetical protein
MRTFEVFRRVGGHLSDVRLCVLVSDARPPTCSLAFRALPCADRCTDAVQAPCGRSPPFGFAEAQDTGPLSRPSRLSPHRRPSRALGSPPRRSSFVAPFSSPSPIRHALSTRALPGGHPLPDLLRLPADVMDPARIAPSADPPSVRVHSQATLSGTLRDRAASPISRSALAVFHDLDGFLRVRTAGLLHPATGLRFIAFPPSDPSRWSSRAPFGPRCRHRLP